MMGAGKSTVGEALASRLGCGFVDTDAEIERGHGRSVSQIFALEGEAAFRAMERDTVAAVAGKEVVVALGGGAMAQPEVRERVTGAGTAIYLRARPETLLGRLGGAKRRPLLASLTAEGRRAKLEALLAEREPAYARASLCVDTDDLELEQVVERLAEALA